MLDELVISGSAAGVPRQPVNVLGLTGDQYAQACKSLGMKGGLAGAFDRYAKLFRAGDVGEFASGQRSAGPASAAHAGIVATVAPINRLHTSESDDGTVLKFTQNVERNPGSPGALGQLAVAQPPLEIESVLIPMIGKKRTRSYTLCVSSQVGCGMGCTFCQTAQMGLIRSLKAHEIIGQWFAARHLVSRPDAEAAIRNVVFMGMGEPMDNLDEVIQAISILTDNRGPELAMCKITVSTVGRIDGIRKLAARIHQPGWHRLGLAISLNAPSDEARSKIMPVNRAMPMADLRRALLDWPFYSGSQLCLEYVLIPGVNDGDENADQLAAYVRGEAFEGVAPRRFEGGPLRGLVNVIPYNPRDNSPWPAPTEEMVVGFLERLSSHSVYVKRRRTKGRDTMAACGQLGNPAMRRGSERRVTSHE